MQSSRWDGTVTFSLSPPPPSLSLSLHLLLLALTLPPYPLHPLHVTFLHQLSISPLPSPFLPSLKPSDLSFIAHARSPIFPLPFELSPTFEPRRYWSCLILRLSSFTASCAASHQVPSPFLPAAKLARRRVTGVVTKLKAYPHKSFVLLGCPGRGNISTWHVCPLFDWLVCTEARTGGNKGKYK